MYFEQFYLGCLSHASYMIGSDGEAVVVDPQRDVEIYIGAARKRGLAIRHIVETHLHADFVSGHMELAERTGATIYVGSKAEAKYPHVKLRQGSEIKIGSVRLHTLETPGHTPESVCFVVIDLEKSEKPWAVLTGDTLFIGDVGRPDLSKDHTPTQLAGHLFDSLHEQLMKLPDETLVYPAHGAGSLCGKNMRAEKSSTIGTERLTNYALQIKDREEFVRQLTSNLPARPDYFSQDAEINRSGAVSLAKLPELKSVEAGELKSLIEQGVIALDVRPNDLFCEAHVPGSVNIALGGQFASWAATILGLAAQPVLVADSAEQCSEARLRLARVGIENPSGYLANGIAGWKDAGFTLEQIPQLSVSELRERMQREGVQALDVRREPEWHAGHIDGAQWWPLDNFRAAPPELNANRLTAVHCKGGYRSVIACSLLRRAGLKNVFNVKGGFDAWREAGLPEQVDAPALV